MNSQALRREWADRSGTYSPEFYAHLGPNETSEAVRSVLRRRVGPDAAVLELGCSSGRHLAHLDAHGFTDLHGIEINDESFEVMAEAYPDLLADGTFHREAIESVVERFDDGEFDAVFSVETLQHLHPESAWVFDELVRITDDTLVTVENEGESGADEDVNVVDDELPLYYRDWRVVFTDRGLAQVETRDRKRDTLRVFGRSGPDSD